MLNYKIRPWLCAIAIATAAVVPLGSAPAQAAEALRVEPTVTLQTFVDELSPAGTWLVIEPYGRVWRPSVAVVGPGFVPYTSRGHWVYTEDGWEFDSDFGWGWAPFHYGRWFRDPTHGWVWAPALVWAPAWVEWRHGTTHVGWVPAAPLGVRVIHTHWTFVETRYFLHPRVAVYAVRPAEVWRVYPRTVALTSVRGAVMWRTGPSVTVISRATHVTVRPLPRRSRVPARVHPRFPAS
jgi:Family of unknown function (DUF6600)